MLQSRISHKQPLGSIDVNIAFYVVFIILIKKNTRFEGFFYNFRTFLFSSGQNL